MYTIERYGIRRQSDNVLIPRDDRDQGYVEYVQWLRQGGTPDNAPALPEPPERVETHKVLAQLLSMGIKEADLLQIMTEEERLFLRAPYIHRNSATVEKMRVALQMTQDEADQFFINAEGIQA